MSAYLPGSHSDERDEFRVQVQFTVRANTWTEAIKVAESVIEEISGGRAAVIVSIDGPDGERRDFELQRRAVPA